MSELRRRAARTVAFSVWGPIARDDLPGLSSRVCALFLANPGTEMLCHVVNVSPDAVTVEALARLQLVAKRSCITVRLRDASAELLALVRFLGLGDVLSE